jgi:ribose transport system substrate-binding protein
VKQLHLVVSLPNQNDYQREQAKAAAQQGHELGAEIRVLDAENDSVNQSQQLLEVLQSRSNPLPDAILAEPLTQTGLNRVADAAVKAGIGWVLLNSYFDYLQAMRAHATVPVFAVTRDHTEIGRIQAGQFAALLPHGGSVLYIQGPATSAAATQRTAGLESAKPANITVRSLRSNWTVEGAREAVSAWLRLKTSRPEAVDLVGCQYDGIAMGARKAFREVASSEDRNRWLALPLTGVDGLPNEGQAWVNQGELAATVVAPITTRVAVGLVVEALRTGKQPPEITVLELKSHPSLEVLAEKGRLRSPRSPQPAA